jgi:hypothetical protein
LPDVKILGAAVEGRQLETVRALHLKAVENPVRSLSEHHRALGAFYFYPIVDHGFVCPVSKIQGKQAVAEIGTTKVLNPTFIE